MSSNHVSTRAGDRAATTTATTRSHGPSPRASWFAACLTLVLNIGAGSRADALESRVEPVACCTTQTNHPGGQTDPTDGRQRIITAAGETRAPDQVADYVGGVAARLRRADGTRVPGDLFLLLATEGSDASARLYDQSPYTHDNGTPADSLESNVEAAALATGISGDEVGLLELTTAAGGGRSGGLTYTIAYLNILSGGAFTGELTVAATGALGDHGYVQPITAIDEKTAAARLADADVLFTPSAPTIDTIDTHATRLVGELFRARDTGATLAAEREWDNYRSWGANRRDGGIDIVAVRHIGDVAAYLCGTGSAYACSISNRLADATVATSVPSREEPLANQAHSTTALTHIR